MKNFKLKNNIAAMMLMVVSALLVIFGHGNEQEGFTLAVIGAVTLSEAEKEGLNADEQKMLIAVKKQFEQAKEDFVNGLVTKSEVEALLNAAKNEIKDDQTSEELKAQIAELKEILKTQGTVLTEIKSVNASVTAKRDLQQFVKEKAEELKQIQKQGHGVIEVELKAAGITGVSTSITDTATPPGSPYLPGSDGAPAYNQIYNPNLILNYVDMGRTDKSVLTWNNELAMEGAPANVTEGNLKPLVEFQFQSEISKAKKVAAYMNITDEFEQDLPGLATQVRRLLQDSVIRKFDDLIQAAIIAVAPGFTLTSMDDAVDNADYWASIGAGIAQITTNNFTNNAIVLNPVTAWIMNLTKGTDGHYVVPPFLSRFGVRGIVEANKVAAGNVLLGDLSQYKVDIYKDYTLKMGFINDDLIRNQFSIVGEIRYHNYISDNRKKALAYFNLATVAAQLEKP